MADKKTTEHSTTQHIQETGAIEYASDTASGSAGKPLSVPESFGRYQLEKKLGEGGMGVVYLAHDRQLNRKVALKIPKFAQGTDEQLIKRFYQEARSAATLTHPNICPIYDVGEIDGTHYIAMGYVQGHPLSGFVNPDKPPSPGDIARIIRKVAVALHEAHTQGLVHRDLKPANIMIDQRNEPIIMDFGLARQVDQDEDARLTKEGTIMGSPPYMSPEQLEGNQKKIGPVCDVYALGVVLYELLTGELPFKGSGSVMSIVVEIFSKDPPSPLEVRSDIDPKVAEICQKAMAKNSDDRYGSMKELATVLEEFLKSAGGGRDNQLQRNPAPTEEPQQTKFEEQIQIVRSLCNKREYSAAVSILEAMVANADPQLNKFTEWAKQELPKVREMAAMESNVVDLTVPSLNRTSHGGDVWNQDFIAPAGLDTAMMPTRQATTSLGLPRWALWLVLPVVVVFIIAFVVARSLLTSDEEPVASTTNAKNQSSQAASQANQIATQGNTRPLNYRPSEPQPVDAHDSQRRGPDEERPGPPVRRGPGLGPPPPRMAEQVFADLDRNRDGALTEYEIPRPHLRFFAWADANRDGSITTDELKDYDRQGRDGPPAERDERFAKRLMSQDDNGDGKVSRDELSPLMRHFMERGDANRDGALDESEASEMARGFSRGRVPGRGEGPRDGGRRGRQGPPEDGGRGNEGLPDAGR